MVIEPEINTNISWADQMDTAPVIAPPLHMPGHHNDMYSPLSSELHPPGKHVAQHKAQPPPNNEAPASIIPVAISYDTNNPVDPALWNSTFGATSLFGTLDFFPHNSINIVCLLQRISRFIQQQNIKDLDLRTLLQLENFAEAV